MCACVWRGREGRWRGRGDEPTCTAVKPAITRARRPEQSSSSAPHLGQHVHRRQDSQRAPRKRQECILSHPGWRAGHGSRGERDLQRKVCGATPAGTHRSGVEPSMWNERTPASAKASANARECSTVTQKQMVCFPAQRFCQAFTARFSIFSAMGGEPVRPRTARTRHNGRRHSGGRRRAGCRTPPRLTCCKHRPKLLGVVLPLLLNSSGLRCPAHFPYLLQRRRHDVLSPSHGGCSNGRQ